jgi:hypothetical protein
VHENATVTRHGRIDMDRLTLATQRIPRTPFGLQLPSGRAVDNPKSFF